MGIGDFLDYETRIRKAVGDAIEEGLKKVPALRDESLDRVEARFKAASETFFVDLEQRWERRLELETKAQARLLNRVLLYSLLVALLSLGYAWARTRIGA
jgi:hypothetical protein